jgi:CHAT domain-containing protein
VAFGVRLPRGLSSGFAEKAMAAGCGIPGLDGAMRGLAYTLYQQLLAPAEPLLAGATSLIIVPDGALQSLPPAVLVTEEPHAPIADVAEYKSVPWLARRYALTVLMAAKS